MSGLYNVAIYLYSYKFGSIVKQNKIPFLLEEIRYLVLMMIGYHVPTKMI